MLSGLLLIAATRAFAQDGPGTVAMGPGQDFYVIQPGDTLWDISQRFLGDAQAWPGLWSLNEYITNPHWIYPGNRIYFRLGDDLEPPGVGLDAAAERSDGYVPPPVVQSAPDLCDFPALFDDDNGGVKLQAPGVLTTASDLNIRGTVYGAEVPGLSVPENTFAYLEIDDADQLHCGDMLGIYRRESEVVKQAGERVGYVYRIVGDVRVVRVDDDIVTVQLRDMTREVVRGDLVGDPTPFRMQLDVGRPTGDARATVLARLNEEQALPSEGETVFLDRGTEDGIDVGTALYVVERHDGMAGDRDAEDPRLPERVVGRVVVVRAEQRRATAVVVDAARDIRVGQLLAANPNGRDE